MKKALFGITACLVLFGLVLTGCEDLMGTLSGDTKVTAVTFSDQIVTIGIGGTKTLTATVYPNDAKDKTLIWKSSNTNVATVNNSGVVTGIAIGDATITAETVDGSNKSATCTVKVTATDTPVTGVTLVPENLVIGVGKGGKLTATVAPAEAANKAVTWSSDDTGVATVNGGVVTGVAVGTAKITVTTADGNKTATCKVTVEEGGGGVDPGTLTPDTGTPVTGVSLDKTTLSVEAGKAEALTPTVTPTNATNKAVKWESSNTDVATVNGGVVTGVAAGSAKITVTTEDGGKTADCQVTVTAASNSGDEDEDDEGEEGKNIQTQITITSLPSHFIGKDYAFGLFPSSTSLENLDYSKMVAGAEGKISGETLNGTLYSEKALNGSYLGLVLIGSTEAPDFVGYATITIASGKASIAASQFTNVTESYKPPETSYPGSDDEDDEGEGGKGNEGEGNEGSQTQITITSLPSRFVGKDYSFGLFPPGTNLANLDYSMMVAGTVGSISDTTLVGTLDSDRALIGSYLGLVLIGSMEAPDFVGYATITIVSGEASIAASRFTDVTEFYEPPGNEHPIIPPNTGNDELADAANWDESQWQSWFNNNPPDPLSSNITNVNEFMFANSAWLANNTWWYSLYYTWWGTGGTAVPGPDDYPGSGGTAVPGPDDYPGSGFATMTSIGRR
jgi:uncharacterized protein YjdB